MWQTNNVEFKRSFETTKKENEQHPQFEIENNHGWDYQQAWYFLSFDLDPQNLQQKKQKGIVKYQRQSYTVKALKIHRSRVSDEQQT